MEEGKSLKQYAKEAKMRLKQGFWQNYTNDLNDRLVQAEHAGLCVSKVKEYYKVQVSNDIKSVEQTEDEFYFKVKRLLDDEGEVSNAIGRLTDKDYYNSLSYEEKQRYNLELSEKYLKAVERYNKEKSVCVSKC